MRIDGLSSGLDTTDIINKLMAIERRPLLLLQDKEQQLTWRRDALLGINTSLLALQTAATTLTYSSTFTARLATSSDENVLTATATNSAANATYAVNVTKLASSSRVISSAAVGLQRSAAATMTSTAEMNTTVGVDADPNAAFNLGTGATRLESEVTAGSFTINGVEIKVASNDTINLVINKINESAAGVWASLSGDKITLKQKTEGASYGIALGADSSGFMAAVKLAGASVTPGKDAGQTIKLNAGDNAALGISSGYFTINDVTFHVDVANESLNDILNKINNSNAGIRAYYDYATDKVTITSVQTGPKDIKFTTATDTSNFITKFNISEIGVVKGDQAEFTINGGEVLNRDSNTFDWNGVNFTLKKTGTSTVTVSTDYDKIIGTVESFVNQYNSTMSALMAKLKEDKVVKPTTTAEKQAGILRNDPTLMIIQQQLREDIFDKINGLPAQMDQLAEIGITTGKPGSTLDQAKAPQLVLDKDKLRKALEQDPNSVVQIFRKGTATVTRENPSGAIDGTNKAFTLAHKQVASAPAPVVTVNGVQYEQVISNPGTNQYTLDYTTGTITFGVAPTTGPIEVTYDYEVTTGADAGVAVRIKSYLGSLTRVGGVIDQRAGKQGIIEKEIGRVKKSIEAVEDRLALREQNLWRQFNTLERIMATLQSQGTWLSSQIGQLEANWRKPS